MNVVGGVVAMAAIGVAVGAIANSLVEHYTRVRAGRRLGDETEQWLRERTR